MKPFHLKLLLLLKEAFGIEGNKISRGTSKKQLGAIALPGHFTIDLRFDIKCPVVMINDELEHTERDATLMAIQQSLERAGYDVFRLALGNWLSPLIVLDWVSLNKKEKEIKDPKALQIREALLKAIQTDSASS